MAYIFNSARSFAEESTAGFVDLYSDILRAVPGGVARATRTPAGQVAVVIGGGSGHYPAFGGLVGAGLAHGAALGNVFASPSALQIYTVAKSVENGGGVLLSYGNYAGDVLNFTQAQDRLRAEGIPCETVRVTDDISSADASERERRRGVAGDLAVFRIAAAAAEAGASLAEVVALAQRANERVRTLGIAFGGATLPGAEEPLFTIPAGRMAVGMGIHGEPGIGEDNLLPANALAALLWDRVRAEAPAGAGARAVVLINGLGSVKHEELFVLYREIRLLAERDAITIVEPEVGELVTSFEMAGVSLSVFWVDAELEALWATPAHAPAYRKGHALVVGERVTEAEALAAVTRTTEASAESRALAPLAGRLIAVIADTVDEHVDELGRLDAVAGDGDHGIGMQRGSRAAADSVDAALADGAGLASLLSAAGDAWADRAGGTSGALWGTILTSVGRELGDTEVPDAARLARAVTAASDAVMRVGGAQPGDKTMVDALVALAESFAAEVASGASLEDAAVAASAHSTTVARATADLLPRMGRARPHAEKALGTPDPGAISLALIATAIARAATPQTTAIKENS